jgi:hypothetical protein
LLKLLLGTRRYRRGNKDFQLESEVDLRDDQDPVLVEVDFLAPREMKLERRKPKLIEGFRVLQTAACGVSFYAPVETKISGRSVRGNQNTVCVNVASIPDFLVMKAHAISGRDKPKDTYDLCYCLTHVPGGMTVIANEWRRRLGEAVVVAAIGALREKFSTVESFGPGQLVEFHSEVSIEARQMHARRAYELVRQLLHLIDSP